MLQEAIRLQRERAAEIGRQKKLGEEQRLSKLEEEKERLRKEQEEKSRRSVLCMYISLLI